MKALKNFKAKIVDPLAGGLGKGSLRDSIGGFGGGKLQDAMQGLGKSKFKLGKLAHGGRMHYGHGGRMSNRELGRMLSKYMGGGRMKYEHGGSHDTPERIDPNDPGFQDFLRSTSFDYFDEYHGMPIGGSTGGGSIYGQERYGEINPDTGLPYERGDRSAGLFDVLGGKHSGDMIHQLAVNPALFAFDYGDDVSRGSFLNKPLQGGRAGATNRDLVLSAIERYNTNLATEQAYRDFLAKQKGPSGERPVRYETLPGGEGFRVTGTQDQLDAIDPGQVYENR